MTRLLSFCLVAVLALAGCDTTPPKLGPDGRPLPKVHVIKPGDEGAVTYSMVDSINSLRSAAGAPPLTLNPLLTAAAATHSRDMAVQNRPWHFGSDGSSPLLRVQRTGYQGQMLGENISETYETELETLSAWMELADTRAVILDPAARDVGFSWYQEPGGKIWWTLVTGG
ncbi:MAG: serine protease [Rhodobacterales bacterium 32-67-9]|nr:MAG: serine protease [Rhodobacterales bacterium 32-67-9]